MKPIFWICILYILAGFLGSATAAERTLALACTHFPPYKIQAPSNDAAHSGIDLDIMRAAFAKVGYDVDFDFYPWKRTVQMAKKGQVDGLCGCNYRPEREQDFIFSDTMGNHSQGVFINASSPIKEISSLNDLAGQSVAVVRGYTIHKELSKHPDIQAVETNNDRQLLRMLNADRIDAAYSFRDIILYRMSHNSAARKVRYFELDSQPYYLCFSRYRDGIEKIKDDFNRGLRTIKYDGTYKAIWQKYR